MTALLRAKCAWTETGFSIPGIEPCRLRVESLCFSVHELNAYSITRIRMLDDAIRYQLLSLLERNPELSQRQLARAIGMSLGKTNYCLKALIERGWVKIDNFRSSRNKRAYLYRLTPSGLREKARVTRRFLAVKLAEHRDLTIQIEQLRREIVAQQGVGQSAEIIDQ